MKLIQNIAYVSGDNVKQRRWLISKTPDQIYKDIIELYDSIIVNTYGAVIPTTILLPPKHLLWIKANMRWVGGTMSIYDHVDSYGYNIDIKSSKNMVKAFKDYDCMIAYVDNLSIVNLSSVEDLTCDVLSHFQIYPLSIAIRVGI